MTKERKQGLGIMTMLFCAGGIVRYLGFHLVATGYLIDAGTVIIDAGTAIMVFTATLILLALVGILASGGGK